MYKLTLAKTAGFCFGVRRAVDRAFQLAAEETGAVTLGPVIHNPQVVERLARLGLCPVDSPEEVPEGRTVLIRSHGVGKSVYDALAGRKIVDCTCPFVEKIHRIAAEQSAAGKTILIAGDRGHPEVQGIIGYCQTTAIPFQTEEELMEILKKLKDEGEKPVAVVAQTTFHEILWKKFQQIIEKLYTNAQIFDTICSATTARQKEAVELARKSDFMVVIGGRSSSNTLKLFEICSRFC